MMMMMMMRDDDWTTPPKCNRLAMEVTEVLRSTRK